jgi:hypothetical protein
MDREKLDEVWIKGLNEIKPIEKLNEFFESFDNKSKDLRDYIEISYSTLKDQVENRCQVELEVKNLNVHREELIEKVKKRLSSKLEKITTSTNKSLNDINIDNLELNQIKDIRLKKTVLLIGTLKDNSSFGVRLKQLPFFKRIDQISYQYDSCHFLTDRYENLSI